MQWKVYTVPVALLALFCAACNGRLDNAKLKVAPRADSEMKADTTRFAGSAFEAPKVVADEQLKEITDEKEEAPPNQSGNGQQHVRTPPPPATDWDRRIVKTADLTLKVRNFRFFSTRLHAAVKQTGGYIAQEQMSQNAGDIENIVTIKVPVDRFELLMGEMPGDSDKLEEKKIASEDVTPELIDTKSHLQTKKEVRERYLELLKQAHSMKDIIAIQSEIDDIQQDMDEAAGRIAYLDHSSAYSTINLRFYEVLDEAAHDEQAPGFAQRLKDVIRDGWTGLSSFLLALIGVWPFCLAVGVIGVWARKRLKRTKVPAAVVLPVKEGA